MRKAFILLVLFFPMLVLAFHFSEIDPDAPVPVPPSVQKPGDAAKGYNYLITGDFLKSGVPYSLFTTFNGKTKVNALDRKGKNATVSHGYNVVTNKGTDVVVPTCLQCHSQYFAGKLIIGLGNTYLDFSNVQHVNYNLSKAMVWMLSPGKYQASRDFLRSFSTVFPEMQTEVRGVNVAAKLAIVLVAHRDRQTLKWSDKPLLTVPDEVYPTDVPAWWLLKKKNAMFYDGFARGDQARFLMLANLLTVKDSAEAREVSGHFSDVLAFIRTIEPPKYPRAIDSEKAEQGRMVFNNNCSRCHGTYGPDGNYPNLLIPISVIQTDSTICQGVLSQGPYVNWFNNSWFAQGENPARIVPFNGYAAPPLDGVWVTAPYLHNGSVPTLEALLNSSLRPIYWARDFSRPDDYDYNSVGVKYTVATVPERRKVYNTKLKGYSNSGHYFGDALTGAERSAIIEYLKTL